MVESSFRVTECAFRVTERPFRILERTFRVTEWRIKTIVKMFLYSKKINGK